MTRIPKCRSQSGQAAVLATLCLFTMVVFVAMATNMGTLVNDRIRFQNTIDSAAYAGGLEQARMLNKLTQINKEIVGAVDDLRKLLNSREWRQPPCSCLDYSPTADQIIIAYQKRLDVLAAKYKAFNKLGNMTPRIAARNTARMNLLNEAAWNPYHLGFFTTDPDSATAPGVLVPSSQVTDTNFSYLYTKSCQCCGSCCPYTGYIREPLQLNTWFYKTYPESQTFFPAKMRGTGLKQFMDLDGPRGFFGAGSGAGGGDDEVTVYAGAKPYEGNLGTSNPGNDGWGPTYDPGISGSPWEKYWFHEEYRTRMAGLKEPMGPPKNGNGQGNITIADMVNVDNWAPKYKGKGELLLH